MLASFGEMSEQGATRSATDIVDLAVPLRVDFAVSVRIMTASLAADVGFTVDEIDDLRLGVSEVFTLLADHDLAAADERCHVTYVVSDGEISVTMRRSGSRDPVELDPLATSILASVVDEHQVDADGVTVVKRASEASGDSND
mgnify:CR=1 FL=1